MGVTLEGKCVITKVGYREQGQSAENEIENVAAVSETIAEKEVVDEPKTDSDAQPKQSESEIPTIVISQTDGIDVPYIVEDNIVLDTNAMGEGYSSVKVQKINSKLDLQQQYNVNADPQVTNWISI